MTPAEATRLAEIQHRASARYEQRLRELMSDLADQVERNEITSAEANAAYARTADRWNQEES